MYMLNRLHLVGAQLVVFFTHVIEPNPTGVATLAEVLLSNFLTLLYTEDLKHSNLVFCMYKLRFF